MNAEVVDASSADLDTLVGIYSSPHLYGDREEARWFVKSFFEYHHIKVVKYQGKIIGAAFWNVVEEKRYGLTYIADFWIDKDFRRRGFGQRLLQAVIDDMKRLYARDKCLLRKVMLATGDDMEPAKNLYEKIGFERVAVLKSLFVDGHNALLYVLTATP